MRGASILLSLVALAAVASSCGSTTDANEPSAIDVGSPSGPDISPQGVTPPEGKLLPSPAWKFPEIKIKLTVSRQRLKPSDVANPNPTFEIGSTRELFFYADVRAAAEQHTLSLRVRGPSGELYDQFHTVLGSRVSAPDRLKVAGGPPEGLQVLRPLASKHFHTEHVLPVAGTFISQYGLKGSWHLEAALDAEATPRAVVPFELQ